MTSASLPPVFHESLPYIDPEPSEDALAAARALIAAEEATSSRPNFKATDQRECILSPALTTELERIASKKPLKPLDLSRYEAQEPQIPSSGDGDDDKDLEPLQKSLQNAYVSASYLASRNENLELLDHSGRNAWLLSNYHLEADLRAIEAELAATKRDIDLLNAARAARQNEVKSELLGLEETWKKGVGRVLETEIAVEEMRQQIRNEMKRQSGLS